MVKIRQIEYLGKLLGPKKEIGQKLFDGTEVEPEQLPKKVVKCPHCKTETIVGFSAAIAKGRIENNFALESVWQIISTLGIRQKKSDNAIYRKHQNCELFAADFKCSKCKRDYLYFFSFGEAQPARYILWWDGFAQVKYIQSTLRRWSSNLLLVGLLSILPLAFLYINYSAYKTWNDSTYLERNGIETDGRIIDREEYSGPRSGPNYYLEYTYSVNGYEYQTRKQVDQGAYVLNDIGDEAKILYDSENPNRSDVANNDYRSLAVFILVIFDVIVLSSLLVVFHKAKKQIPAVED